MSGCYSLVLFAALSGGASDVTLVEFTDPRCQPCRAMQPVVQRLASEKFPIRQVDVTREPQLARQYRIVAYPTFVLFAGDREVQRFAGVTTYDDLVQMISRGQMPRELDQRSLATAGSAPLVRGQSPDPSQAAAQTPTAEQRALAATVRLKVQEEGSWGVGTGTIIDTHFDEQSQQHEALVLTCGHLFKSSGGKGKIEVELFAPGARSPVAGELLDYDEHLDIALLSIWPGVKVAPAIVAAPSDIVRPQDVVFTVGCSEGQDPTVERSKIHAVNRYANRPNLTVGGRPAQGRSGGGLFNAAGQLIGVCNADDPADGEGIYAGPAAIHSQLDKFNLQAVYQRAIPPLPLGEGRGEGRLVSHEEPAADRGLVQSSPAVATAPLETPPNADVAPPQPFAAGITSPLTPPAGGARTELVCVLRSADNPQGQSEVLVIDGASAALIQQILAEAKATGQARMAARQGTAAQPVIRGQR
ncbi:MAG TPA: trypsin-like peptidase domain-containing protein [Pirellulaceae bacterium]|nr:trypsin-like peptidase domain-containing protein [Pirellulaceae bacterium]